MALRPPQDRSPSPNPLGPNPLQYELMEEMAGSLGRAAKLLTKALEDLSAFDDTHEDRVLTDEEMVRRADLLAEACERLWFFIIQREICGLRRHHDVFEIYAVPREVQIGMGPKPRKPDQP